jgi:hypothetical protein
MWRPTLAVHVNGFITIPCNVLREALERVEDDTPGNDSFKEYLALADSRPGP